MADGSTTPPQKFCTSMLDSSPFEGGGLRDFFSYRDLGIKDATHGRYGAHVIRANQQVTEGTGRHSHALDFQMFYVLKGWVRFTYEGEGEFTFRAGDSCLQPPGIEHELIECSADMELLEITAPADFGTTDAK